MPIYPLHSTWRESTRGCVAFGPLDRQSRPGNTGRPSALLLDCLRLACGLVGDQRDRGRGCRSIRSALRARTRGCVAVLDRQSRGIEHRSERTPVRASPRLSPPRMRAGRRSTGSGEGMSDLSALLHVRGKAPGAASRLVRSTGKAARVSNTGRNGRPSALLLDCLRFACGLVGDRRDRGRECRSIRSAPRAREGTRGLRRGWPARPAKPPRCRTPTGTDARPRFNSARKASHL